MQLKLNESYKSRLGHVVKIVEDRRISIPDWIWVYPFVGDDGRTYSRLGCFLIDRTHDFDLVEEAYSSPPVVIGFDPSTPVPVGLPTEAATRKAIPIYSGFVKYFPDAIAAVAELSRIANEQHNPGEELHWAKEKSSDEGDALMRHQTEHGAGRLRDLEGVLHATKVAWRGMAQLQRLADSGVNIFQVLSDDNDAG